MSADQLRLESPPRRIGRRIRVLDEVDSTNAVALAAAREPDADGLVILAEYQTAGRGRQGRTWHSPRGASVLCSALLVADEWGDAAPASVQPEPAKTSSDPGPRADAEAKAGVGGWLTLAAGVAACEAIREATDVAPVIKWPNDLRISGRKLAGTLIESCPLDHRRRAWVIGIGINCLQHTGHFPPELRDQATSLDLATAHAVDRVQVARALLERLDHWLDQQPRLGNPELLEAWAAHAEPVGQCVRLRCQGREYSGRTVSVDPFGGLVVQLDDGRREWFDPLVTTLI